MYVIQNPRCSKKRHPIHFQCNFFFINNMHFGFLAFCGICQIFVFTLNYLLRTSGITICNIFFLSLFPTFLVTNQNELCTQLYSGFWWCNWLFEFAHTSYCSELYLWLVFCGVPLSWLSMFMLLVFFTSQLYSVSEREYFGICRGFCVKLVVWICFIENNQATKCHAPG